MKNKAKEIKNVVDLRVDLLDIYGKLRNGEIGIREAKETANVAGKVLSSAKLQLEYNTHTKSDAKIPFLEVNE